MIRQMLKFSAILYLLFCVFSLLTTETLGDVTQSCEPRPFNATYNISDSNQCDKYFECLEGNLTTRYCEHGFRFSEENEKCEEVKKVNCSGREYNPGSLINPEQCKREEGLFLCKYGKECIAAEQVCNGNFDCLDGSDEFDKCESSCSKSFCTQRCIPNPDTPGFGFCYCNSGYTKSSSNNSECDDIDECKIFGSCTQLCNNTEGSFKCSCMEGFTYNSTSNVCTPTEPRWKLVYTTRTEVGVISKGSNGRERNYRLTNTDGRPVGVSYDARNNVTYWTDVSPSSESVYRSTMDGKFTEIIVDTGLSLPEGIAFDWITGNIYIADSNQSHIAVCRNDTNFCTVLIQQVIDKPRDIALHPNQGIMFWTDWGASPMIVRAGMDGSTPMGIIVTNLKWPNGITVDQGSSRIFWVDASLDKIETSFFDGSDRQVVVTDKNRRKHPFGVDVLANRIFWSDWNSHEIKSADKFTGLNSKVHVKVESYLHLNGIAVFHKANQPIQRSNPCQKSRCSHICTLTPASSFKCFCPVGMVLDENDGRTCSEPENTPKLLVAFKNTIKTMRFNSIGKHVFESITFPEIKSINAVVYNPINHTIIMSDAGAKKIYEYVINRKKLNVLVDQHLDMVKGMDIDVVGENLYWVDGGRQTLEAMSFRTGARIVLMGGVDSPGDILVASEMRMIFLSRMGKRGGKIYRMQMNGYSNTIVQRVGEKEPIALFYDRERGNMIWADKKLKGIESLSPDGRTSSVIIRLNSLPYDVMTFQNQVFWTDMFTHDIKFLTRGSSNTIRSLRPGSFETDSWIPTNGSSTSFFGKLAIINRDLSYLDDLRSRHECSMNNPTRKNCSHLCLLSKDGYTGVCHCPEGLTLDPNGMTCSKPSTCSADQFTCSDGNCISRSYICDGTPDCTNSDDEVNCNERTCLAGFSKCDGSGVCIPNHWICDGDADCVGGVDEVNCTYIPCNPDFDFRCESSGRCIPMSWKCDRALDCPGDDSDERGCNFTCPDGFFKCANSLQCVMMEWVCDNEKDCGDGSDEMENCEVKSCLENQFACNSGTCISKEFVCDGYSNCAHDEDENGCEISGRSGRIDDSSNDTIAVSLPTGVNDKGGSGTTAAIVIGVLVIIVLVAVIIALVLHKRNIQPKVLVRPYVQHWNKYVNEPARRMFGDGRGQQKLDCEKHVYDEVYAGGSATYCNTALYEEVDSIPDFEPRTPPGKRSQRDAAARSYADSGILGSERDSLYEEAEDCGSHYVSYSQKDKLIAN